MHLHRVDKIYSTNLRLDENRYTISELAVVDQQLLILKCIDASFDIYQESVNNFRL